jgi:molybdate/tungstate transport system substrate-binding protein
MNGELLVAHAGSLTALLQDDLVPGFTAATRCNVTRRAGPAVGLANLMLDNELAPDVYMSADSATNQFLMGQSGGDKVRWYLGFARTRMVLVYSPHSRFQAEFAAAADGESLWFEVLQQPGLVFLRSDPRVDPGGYRTLFVFQLAEQYYQRPGLREQLLHGDANEAQLLAGRPNLFDGSVDAVMMYVTSALDYGLPFIQLPEEIDLSSQALADWYRTASYTNPRGQRFDGAPATYSITIPQSAANPDGAAGFVTYLFSEPGRAALQRHGFAPTKALLGGDPAAVPSALQPLIAQNLE